MESDKISISGLTDSATAASFPWLLKLGCSYLVYYAGETVNAALLDHLAGRRQDRRISIDMETADGTRQMPALPSAGLLPAPGEEIFVGTTIAEQLNFFSRGEVQTELEQSGLDNLFAFDFASRLDRSVWELASGERRCLLLVAQALADPRYWILHQPLAGMDGRRGAAIRAFIRDRCARGAIVIAGTARPAELLGCCPELLVLGDDGQSVKYHGIGVEAAAFLAAELALPFRVLESALDLTGAVE
ncbi:hypothetical protein ACFL4X_00675 [Gemmatimonadota bacterium]